MPDIYTHQSYETYSEEIPEISMGGTFVQINLMEGMVLEEVNLYEVKKETHTKPVSLKLAKILGTIGALVLLIYFIPSLLSLINFSLSSGEVGRLTKATADSTERNLPTFNPLLPKTNKVMIPSIGVDTNIEEATYDNYEEALKNGVWRVSNFGEPDEFGAPIILAAHRYGYLAWTNTFRHKSSFYNLPKMKVGDTVVIDWQQREYTYGVYKTETGKEITDYSADIILYTCESLSGEERIFVYAKLIS